MTGSFFSSLTIINFYIISPALFCIIVFCIIFISLILFSNLRPGLSRGEVFNYFTFTCGNQKPATCTSDDINNDVNRELPEDFSQLHRSQFSENACPRRRRNVRKKKKKKNKKKKKRRKRRRSDRPRPFSPEEDLLYINHGRENLNQ